ncbi:MAG TPA: SCO family protein [Pyrinomonadaceae bacterium]|nr:SCO family protein [Pyrinomonadaceae bacterium]
MKILLNTSFLILIAVVLLSPACKKERTGSATEKRYELTGKVVQVDKDQHSLTIAHQDIKDYMPNMTMPFQVGEDWWWIFTVPVQPGDHISATLVVDGAKLWLEDVTISSESSENTAPVSGEGIGPKEGEEVPDYRLVNQDNKEIRLHDYRGKALVLTFIYTRCPDPTQCTLMSNNFAAIDQELQKEPELYAKTHLLSISFDPEYDTPKVLRSYGASFTGRYTDETFQHWEFATGSEDEVKGIAQYFGMRYYLDTESGKSQVIHSLRTAVIGPDGKIIKVYRGNDWKPDQIVSDLHNAVKNE